MKIPDTCPIDTKTNPIAPLLATRQPNEEALINHASELELFMSEVKNPTSTPLAIGSLGCRDCEVVDLCKSAQGSAESLLGVELVHPTEIKEHIDAQSYASMWAASISIIAESKGYNIHKVANIMGKIAELNPAMRDVVFTILEADSSRLPVSIGTIQLSGSKHEMIEFDDVRLVVRNPDNLETAAARPLIDVFTQLMGRSENSSYTRLRTGLQTGIVPYIKSMKVAPMVKEFKPSTSSPFRAFGKFIGREDDKQADTIIISAIENVKGGVDRASRIAVSVGPQLESYDTKLINESIRAAIKNKTVVSLNRQGEE